MDRCASLEPSHRYPTRFPSYVCLCERALFLGMVPRSGRRGPAAAAAAAGEMAGSSGWQDRWQEGGFEEVESMDFSMVSQTECLDLCLYLDAVLCTICAALPCGWRVQPAAVRHAAR